LNASYERLTQDFERTKERLEATERTLDGYMGLMKSTEKTKAFLMLEDVSDLSLKEIGRSLGVSPAIVRQWADDFVRLGIAEIIDNQKLAITHRRPRDEESTTQ
jgi:hypothetical protein